MNNVYTAAVVGGGAGGKLSLAALAASDRFQPLAAADLRADVREELAARYSGLRVFASHTEMFEACPVEVVCVSTYPPSHQQVALDALKLPLKGILVEKPLGDTVAAGRAILAAIRERGLPMVVPHGLLVARHCQEIFERVERGEIGQLRLLEIECDKWDIINAGIHWLNFFVALTKRAPIDYVLAACDATTRTYRDGMQVETLAVTYAQTTGGVRVVMQTGDYVKILPEGKPAVFRLVGTAGTIEFWGWESAYRIVSAQHPHGLLVQVAPHAVAGHRAHLESLASQIDRAAPDYALAESSLIALELCEAAYLSSAHRCVVRFPLEHFSPPPANDWAPGQTYAGSGGGRDGRQLPAEAPYSPPEK
ncbi:MAG TPA: Gfo/Idh/MocA family oxidoreductase [Roseiflexaceae bacterium]|nr:Gfo/Idh/MocA family oxidoreductase [Roseiflexaceae bacterium]